MTKQGLADYYTGVWPHIPPYIVGRPLASLRCPTGFSGDSFFQKHAWKELNANLKLIKDPTAPDDGPLISIDDLDGLLGLVQSAVVEIHLWGSTIAEWEHSDMIIMDLDPGEGVTWQNVVAAAEEVRQRLSACGLAAFVKTSGGKGLHVMARLAPKADWATVKTFAKGFADALTVASRIGLYPL